MGLFDGARDGTGSTADLAARLGLPVVLVVDARGQGASVAALAEGFANHRPDVAVEGVILNRVASAAHETLLRDALDARAIPVLGAVPRAEALGLPSRHLGLVQACESEAPWLEDASAAVAGAVDTDALAALARPLRADAPAPGAAIPPLGQRVAVARDEAFGFCYEALLEDWRAAGAAILPFSPLADEAPDAEADAVYLPGGYPELHAGRIAGAARFLAGLRAAAGRGAVLFGECGGYMVLGRGLADADGRRHAMAGLLAAGDQLRGPPACPRLPPGASCRRRPPRQGGDGLQWPRVPLLPRGLRRCRATPVRGLRRHRHASLGHAGMSVGTVSGSFIHLIDRV